MHRTFSLRFLPLLLASLVTIFTPLLAAQEAGVQIRGPKTTDSSIIKQYGPITNADTLWKIALMVRPDPRFSVYQVMQALYVKNPQAFKENNLNHLVNGQYLQIPTYAEISAIDPLQAQLKSDNDDTVWEKKVKSQPKPAKKTVPANVVQKKDLEEAKSEINQQLEDIGKTQEQRLETIQNDVLDSIDGLQAILEENEKLKKRLSNFNTQLDEMQQEVAKGEEIKAQMDSLITLQQELLDKANAREQELLIEKQKAALEADDFMSSIWFTVLVATVPAVLLVGIVVFFIRRKQPEQASEPVAEKKVTEKVKEEEDIVPADVPTESAEEKEDDISLDGELSLDDELALDLTEDDDLSDLDDTELGGDQLFSDDLDDLEDELLDDEVIHLDDDLDDLEDISLDDLDAEDNSALDADDLDDLLDQTADEGEALEGGELGQDMLDDLLGSIDTEISSDETEAPSNDQDDIDALLADVNALTEGDGLPSESSNEDSADVSDPDDIDALLDSVEAESAETESPVAEDTSDVTDPDDIDTLLDSIDVDSAETESPETESPAAEDTSDVTDPDDIDALLDSIEADSIEADSIDVDSAETENPAAEDTSDVTDPDDIDALLDSIEADSIEADSSDVVNTEADSAETESPVAEDPIDVTDPDDIDALLDSIEADSSDVISAETESPAAEDTSNVTDPDDIDALLDSIEADSVDAESTETESPEVEDTIDVTDPDDIDALLDSIEADSEEADSIEEPSEEPVTDSDSIENATEDEDIDALIDEISATGAEDPSANLELTDPDDIDALLSSFDSAPEVDNSLTESEPESLTDVESSKDDVNEDASLHREEIDNFTQEDVGEFLTMDFSDLADNTESADAEEAADELTVDVPQEDIVDIQLDVDSEQEVLDVDDILDSIQEEEINTPDDSEVDFTDDIENLDVDQLLAEVADESQDSDGAIDIGDELVQNEDVQVESIEAEFDEQALANLLNEDDVNSDEPVELTPDFTDSNVLADLLSDGESPAKEEASEANEIDDIQELNDLDFDELLANIEEENTPTLATETPVVEDVIDDLDIGDDIVSIDEGAATEDEYVSVDSILSDSLEPEPQEPYNKQNIDVGLDEFPEFAGEDTDIDEEDSNGIAAKLDLAKVYIEIGDEENAEVILQDVIKLGDAQQQFEAQQLLDNLN